MGILVVIEHPDQPDQMVAHAAGTDPDAPVHDGDDRTVRRLLARFAELATVADLYALREALDAARPSGNRERSQPRRPGS
ncbi:hypothetical protein ACIRST_41995 [Kitasatospora sp. NPDC101447]|uniref:hypothetical protein n=1 Tax=Kitasatospora sp. NPDC101447 TaxID=3364102 RepID=UPI00382053D0